MTQLHIWEHPADYGGFSPDGHILVLSRTRDSDALSASNWDCARERLAQAGGLAAIPADDSSQPVYDWRASHWACGWIEYLMVRPDAPEVVLREAQAIADDLADYPALNEDDWSQREYEGAQDYWASCTVRERAEMIRDWAPECSIFAARRDWIPSDEHGGIYARLREY